MFHFHLPTVPLSVRVNTTIGSIRSRDRFVIPDVSYFFISVTHPFVTYSVCSTSVIVINFCILFQNVIVLFFNCVQVQFKSYYACSGLLQVFFLMFIGIIFAVMTKICLGISLLKAVCNLTIDSCIIHSFMR